MTDLVKILINTSWVMATFFTQSVLGQPSFTGWNPDGTVVEDATLRRSQYLARVNEVIDWRIGYANLDLDNMDLRSVTAMLVRKQNLSLCSQRVLALMQNPATGPFWMLRAAAAAYHGRGLLTTEAQAAIRRPWQTIYQQRGDTENHFVMYYTALYLMSQLYPDETGDAWFNGKSSSENLAESREFLIHWMDVKTTVASGEYNSTTYIAEYAIPMIYLAYWAADPELKKRGTMMLDWIFADLALNTLNGMLRGPISRTDDTAIVERWNTATSSQFAWLNFNACPPRQNFGAFGYDYAYLAANYEVPEIIYRIAMDREKAFEQRDLKRTSARFRYSDVKYAPVYKTSYMTNDYAVGSYQAGLGGTRIQEHVWDVTWAVPDPRGIHNSMFSTHPHSSARELQVSLAVYPDTIVSLLYPGGKPSYDEPDKLLGSSRYEQVFQHKDTVIALYDIPEGTRFPQINGFFSKDLVNLTEDESGWIFAQGGNTYLAYRPLAAYHWIDHRGYRPIPSMTSGRAFERTDTGSKVLVSPHLKNGTIVQAASASDFENFDAFMDAIRGLPLEFDLEASPTVKIRTLRGEQVVFTFDKLPTVNGKPVDYSKWKLFEGPYLNAEKDSKRLVLTHGSLRRVIDFNTLTLADTPVNPVIDPPPGDYPEQVEVRISEPSSEATIRYTLDGSEPDENSSLFNETLILTGSATVKAKTFESGLSPSDTVVAEYEIWPTQTSSVEAVGGSMSVDFEADSDLFVIVGASDDWITISNVSGSAGTLTVEYNVSASNRVEKRIGTIWAEADGKSKLWVTVEQAGTGGSVPVNLSTRAAVGTGPNILIPGIVVKGPDKTKLLLRGIGPGLEIFGLEGTLRDPGIAVYSGSEPIISNGDWQEAPEELSGYFAEVGAFPLGEGSRDSAVYLEVDPGSYTMHLAGSGGGEGIALAEVYVVRPEVLGSGLVNLSARAEVGSGGRVLVPGFVISGDESRRVLIRGIGPGLAQYGISNYLPDPEIEVFFGERSVDYNQDWSDTDPERLIAAFSEAGAPLLENGSNDAALLMELPPGAYTAHIRSSDGSLGVALLEVFFLL